MLTGTRPGAVEQGELAGKRVAGESEVVGTVRVITDVDEIHTFKEGEILVARLTDPTWYPLFAQAKGIITEVGGWLSHAAIVAREYDLPAIVGVTGVCQQLKTGDTVLMTLEGSIEMAEERRDENSPLRSVTKSSDQPVTQGAEQATEQALAQALAQAEADVAIGQTPSQGHSATHHTATATTTNSMIDANEQSEAENTSQNNVYSISDSKMAGYLRNNERRARKTQLKDRRENPRLDEESGELSDRRIANIRANAEKMRKAS